MTKMALHKEEKVCQKVKTKKLEEVKRDVDASSESSDTHCNLKICACCVQSEVNS